MKYVIVLIFTGCLWASAIAATRFRPTSDLVAVAHRILDMGYECRASGIDRTVCHSQLTVAISQHIR